MDLAGYLRKLSQRFHKSVNGLSESILQSLDRTGQRVVEIARNTKTYQDKTGNLTASIGYGVYHNGVQYSVGGFGRGEGGDKGREKLETLAAKQKNKPYVLIVVAGMDYATYVERSGYIVLDAAGLQVECVANTELNKARIYEV